MRIDILKALIENSTLLVAAFLFLTRLSRWGIGREPIRDKMIRGTVFALCGFLAILFSVEVLPGVLIDMRTPVLVTAAFTGGPLVGIIAAIPLLLYRLLIGGVGMAPGMGIILSALAFGLLLRFGEKSRFRMSGIFFQLSAGLGSAAIYLGWILVLPDSFSMYVFNAVAVPLCLTSVVSILAIFLIRSREKTHQELLSTLTEVKNLYEELSLDENIGILILQDDRIVHVNQSLLTKFGFNRFDEYNSDLLQMVDSGTRIRVKNFLERDFSGSSGEAVPIEITIGSRSLHLLVHARKHFYIGVDSMLVISVDITKLVTAERTLQSKLEQLQLTLEASGAVSWSASVKEDRLTADKEFFQLLSYSPPEEPPRFSHWLLELSMSDNMRSNMNLLCTGEIESIFGEISYQSDDSSTRWFNIGAIAGHGTRRISGIIFDTTAIKEKELSSMKEAIENIQAQKMEAIGRLAGGVAHDFNNLLHIILGYCDILNRVSDHDPVIKDISEPIVESAEKGRELVKQLLLFSREKKPLLKAVNLITLTSSFEKLLSRIMEQNITVFTEIHCDSAWIFGDPGHVEQVLMNLCVNARDAMENGGTIRVVLDQISVTSPLEVTSGFVKPGNYISMTVIDNGPGIPESDHKNIFEPFFTTKPAEKGTGMGLATVMGIVTEHSGYINVKNRENEGVEIRILFPELKVDRSSDVHVQVKETESLNDSGNDRSFRSICILLAEDDKRIMNLTVEGLGTAGIRAFRAGNGKEAVEVYKKRKDEIEMLVFDVMMPEMSGPEAYKEILSLGSTIPVVFTTGYAGDRLAIIEGTHEVLNKPYAVKDLIAIIYRMTDEMEEHGNQE
ncbi:MAG: response regulator [Candidatus Sabulitectum sp.]|nr:response regulator [Candidatus Sabulitectum sp.]